MIYMPSLINIGSGIQKLIWGVIHIQTHRHAGNPISPLLFLQNNESRLLK
jgi:hypothetical protein